MVDYIGFREFVSSLQPLFKLISRNTLKSGIPKIYDNEKEKALKMMDKNGSRMPITANMWTSSKPKKKKDSWSLLFTLSITLGRCKARF